MRVASKLTIDLGAARNKFCITVGVSAVEILSFDGTDFDLYFQFLGQEIQPLHLDETEAFPNTTTRKGDRYNWDIMRLLLTNTAQAGKTLCLIIEKDI